MADMMRGSGILRREERMRRLVIERITHIFPESIVSITGLSHEEVKKIISDCRSSPRS